MANFLVRAIYINSKGAAGLILEAPFYFSFAKHSIKLRSLSDT